jgi:hypothetical protein
VSNSHPYSTRFSLNSTVVRPVRRTGSRKQTAQPNTNIDKARERGKDIVDRRVSYKAEPTPDQQGLDPSTWPDQGNWRRAPGGVEREVGVLGSEAAPARTHLERRLAELVNMDIRRCPETCDNLLPTRGNLWQEHLTCHVLVWRSSLILICTSYVHLYHRYIM